MKNWLILVLMALLIASLNSQSINGVGLGTAVASAAQCVPSPGATVTLCPVTGDGLYLSIGSGPFAKVSTSTAVPVFTKVSCPTASHTNTGLVASGCTIN